MNRKLSKILILTIQFIVFAIISYLCFLGLNSNCGTEDIFRFAECFIRCACYVIFMFLYIKSISSKFGTNTILLSRYLLFAVFSEMRVISSVTKVTGIVFFDPVMEVRLTLFSIFTMILCLAGYGLYYSNNEHSEIRKYFWLCFGASVIICSIIPIVTDTMTVLTIKPVRTLLEILFATTAIIFLSQFFTARTDSYSLRLVAGLILCLGNALNILFDSFLMNEIATILAVIGLIIIYAVAKLSDVKL